MGRIDCRTVDKIVPGQAYFHEDVAYLGSDFEGCCDEYRCRTCGTEFTVELPE